MINSFTLSKSMINDAYLKDLEKYDTRYNIYYGGAGSGKSHFAVQKLIFKLLKQKRKLLVIRKISATMRDSVFALFKSILADWGLLALCRVNGTFMEIELPNGSVIIMKGLDDSEKIKSIAGIDDIFIEEATELLKNDFSQLDLRLRSNKDNNQIHLCFNPVSKTNWVYKEWFDDVSINEDTKILHTTYEHNRFLPDSYIKALLNQKETNYEYFKIYALGEFATLDKLVFENINVQAFDYLDLVKDGLEAKFGLDFGYVTDPTAFVATLYDKDNKKIYIYDEFYEKGLLNDEIADKIISMGYRKEKILADSAEPKSIAELKRIGINRIVGAKKGPGSIMSGIQFLKQHEIIVHPNCINIIEEFQNYSWKKDRNGEYVNVPIDDFNHEIDSLRYAYSDIGSTGKVKLFDKALLGF